MVVVHGIPRSSRVGIGMSVPLDESIYNLVQDAMCERRLMRAIVPH